MTAMSIEVTLPRRSAKAKLHGIIAKDLGLIENYILSYDDYDCFVLFPSQEMDNGECTPVFVCEFLNGKIRNVPTEAVTFVDTDENGVIR